LIERIAREHPGKRIEVWFQDEARFGQQGTLTRVWAPVGSRPRAVKQTQYDYLYVLGAVCPQTGRTAGLLAPNLNTHTVNAFFDQLAKEIKPQVHVVLIWDQAGYHTSGELKVPANVTLVNLPPRSPELNPVENLWHWLRSHHWSNRIYANYDALRAAACDAWQRSCLNPKLIKSVCAVPWLKGRI
jgi:transposase